MTSNSKQSRLSTAKSSQLSESVTQLSSSQSQASFIFDPNMIVEENSVLAQLIKTNVTLLQKCLVSSNQAIFLAAIENLKNASNNFGPALNKHLPIALHMVKKKQDLASIERIHDLKNILIANGGQEAQKILQAIGLK